MCWVRVVGSSSRRDAGDAYHLGFEVRGESGVGCVGWWFLIKEVQGVEGMGLRIVGA